MYGQLPPGEYAAYLRKSRIDLESESRGAEDTFKVHRRTLIDLAKRFNITISEVYQEKPATSGERISERPEMIRLIGDVEGGKWNGILVVEVERLARGDTMDQGIVAQAFKYSNTLIITPMRTYDPTNPDDEEYFEFGLFMSRREFKTITRRLQGGRTTAVIDGRYAGNIAPYGYVRKKLEGKGWTLEPHQEQSPIVELIFSLYTDPDPEKRMGSSRIARYLNETLKIPTLKGAEWTVATINGILRNPTYIGNVRWKSRPQVRKKDGKSRPRVARENTIEKKGLHAAIVTSETFDLAQRIMKGNSHIRSVEGKITNPLAGLVKCGICGKAMVGRPYKDKDYTSLICSRPRCPNVSSYLHIVEERILSGLTEWLKRYSTQWERKSHIAEQTDAVKQKAVQSAVEGMRKKLSTLQGQKNNLHDLLEQGVYTVDVFMERSVALKKTIEEIEEGIRNAEAVLEEEEKRISANKEIIPKVKEVLSLYPRTSEASKKNELLKSVLSSATYRKDKGGRWSGVEDQFTLDLFPKAIQ
ncbi:recombinase family protein [Cohnella cholangitidis]|uniref:Recombinase family protein n=1 Tax=Cohnella cholangitidis TaxID=2598458 RepID=A0A7G5C3C9_9BACL|nr:recombinase family protein [Cohnella cholangitidis]QMV43713.1 recombinase family protein [Cohnella cholangitidis]